MQDIMFHYCVGMEGIDSVLEIWVHHYWLLALWYFHVINSFDSLSRLTFPRVT